MIKPILLLLATGALAVQKCQYGTSVASSDECPIDMSSSDMTDGENSCDEYEGWQTPVGTFEPGNDEEYTSCFTMEGSQNPDSVESMSLPSIRRRMRNLKFSSVDDIVSMLDDLSDDLSNLVNETLGDSAENLISLLLNGTNASFIAGAALNESFGLALDDFLNMTASVSVDDMMDDDCEVTTTTKGCYYEGMGGCEEMIDAFVNATGADPDTVTCTIDSRVPTAAPALTVVSGASALSPKLTFITTLSFALVFVLSAL
jgi:hypothetical protein